jgi:hypothetical protein
VLGSFTKCVFLFVQACIDAGGERCQPVIKTIDGRPTKEHVLRLLAERDSFRHVFVKHEHSKASASSSVDECTLRASGVPQNGNKV